MKKKIKTVKRNYKTKNSDGGAKLAGFGRMSFAYPDLANDIIEKGAIL